MAVSSDFRYSPDFAVNSDVQSAWAENGFIIVRGLLNGHEVDSLNKFVATDPAFAKYSYGRDDGEGRKAKLILWNHPGDDITGAIARSEKVATTMEKLLGGEVYHYHSKFIMKEAHTGGAHIWHQDYGYWYLNGCLSPDMGTVWIALDKADKSNGCLKILKGSHKAGRVDHIRVGDQVGADPERVELLSNVLELVYLELEPGDAAFFHSNLLHRSDQNSSPRRRYGYLVCFNRADNDPVYEHHHPKYIPLVKVPNSTILDSVSHVASDKEKEFFGDVPGDVKQEFSLREVEVKKKN